MKDFARICVILQESIRFWKNFWELGKNGRFWKNMWIIGKNCKILQQFCKNMCDLGRICMKLQEHVRFGFKGYGDNTWTKDCNCNTFIAGT